MKGTLVTSVVLLVLGLCSAQYLYFTDGWVLGGFASFLRQQMTALCFLLALTQLLALKCSRGCCICIIVLLYFVFIYSLVGMVLFGLFGPLVHLCAEQPFFCVSADKQICGEPNNTGEYSSLLYTTTVFIGLVVAVSFMQSLGPRCLFEATWKKKEEEDFPGSPVTGNAEKERWAVVPLPDTARGGELFSERSERSERSELHSFQRPASRSNCSKITD